jgi:hypothetical protein
MVLQLHFLAIEYHIFFKDAKKTKGNTIQKIAENTMW